MAERLLIQIDLDDIDNSTTAGINLRTVSYLGRVLIKVTSENYSKSKAFLISHFTQFTTYCDATALGESLDQVISLLDHGASKLFVSEKQLLKIDADRLLSDSSRLVASLDNSVRLDDLPGKKYIHAVSGIAKLGVAVDDFYDWTILDGIEKRIKRTEPLSCYVVLEEDVLNQYGNAVARGHAAIIPAKRLTSDPENFPHRVTAWQLVTAAIHTDRADGLYPTVVTDEHAVCLGLVYSNHESIEKAIRTGSGVYWSRSRNKLWIKGAESGDTQELISIGWDCDADALQVIARQKGIGRSLCIFVRLNSNATQVSAI